MAWNPITNIRGPKGDSGNDGLDAGFRFQWSTNTSNSDPGSGKIKSVTSPATIAISETDADGNDLGGLLTIFGNASASAIRLNIFIIKDGAPSGFNFVPITSAFTDQGSYRTASRNAVVTDSGIADGDMVRVHFLVVGDKGDFNSGGAVTAHRNGSDQTSLTASTDNLVQFTTEDFDVDSFFTT